MPTDSFEIRICNSCGLRYPLVAEPTFGTRCPSCLGETWVALSRKLATEPTRDLPLLSLTPDSYPRSASQTNTEKGQLAALLDNIRSAWNVGSILRSADGFGFTHAYLCGVTPTPENNTVQKTSLGAQDSVTWSYHKDAVKLVNGLKKEGWNIVALEEDVRAIPITRASPSDFASARPSGRRDVLIVGNEVAGVDPELLDLCNTIYYIPMRGQKRSFNVAIAFGIAAYAIR